MRCSGLSLVHSRHLVARRCPMVGSTETPLFPGCAKTGPLFGPNKLKLGIFGLNVSSAGALTTAKDRHEIDWDQNVRLVQAAEAAGFRDPVPFPRRRGVERLSHTR